MYRYILELPNRERLGHTEAASVGYCGTVGMFFGPILLEIWISTGAIFLDKMDGSMNTSICGPLT